MVPEPFSILLSAYLGTETDELQRCFESILDQSVLPGEIVIVFDGPVRDGVEAYVNSVHAVRVKPLPRVRHMGLGISLRQGLEECSFGIVARMDTDDICVPGRFEAQMQFLDAHEEISVVGGLLREHHTRAGRSVSVTRDMPCDTSALRGFAKLRNPINHQTAMFRKIDVVCAGSYVDFPWFEDYHLWARMLMRNYQFANLDRVLVETRVGPTYFKRRGGLRYLVQELKLARAFRAMGFHDTTDTAKFVLSRMFFRIVPAAIRAQLYRGILRRNGQQP